MRILLKHLKRIGTGIMVMLVIFLVGRIARWIVLWSIEWGNQLAQQKPDIDPLVLILFVLSLAYISGWMFENLNYKDSQNAK